MGFIGCKNIIVEVWKIVHRVGDDLFWWSALPDETTRFLFTCNNAT